MRLRNLAVAPVARLVKSERLARPVGHFRAEFAVAGMVCSRWVRRIKRALDGLHGTSEVQVSLEEDRVILTYDSNTLGIAKMIDVIQRSVIFPGLRRGMKRAAPPTSGEGAP